MLPNFLCIGAQKAGTTSLCHLLERHPDVYMARPRETRFFVDDALYETGVAGYELGWFSGWSGQAAVGEKTPEYLLFEETPARVRRLLGGDVRLLVCLRDPAARAHSHYRHNLMMGVEQLPFTHALAREPERTGQSRARTAYFGYRHRGAYSRRLAPWLEVFDAANFLFIDFDDIAAPARLQATADRILRFLGLPDLAIDDLAIGGRTTPMGWSVDPDRVRASRGGAPVEVRAPSAGLRAWAAQAQRLDPTPPSAEALRALRARWWPDEAARLSALTGCEFAGWR